MGLRVLLFVQPTTCVTRHFSIPLMLPAHRLLSPAPAWVSTAWLGHTGWPSGSGFGAHFQGFPTLVQGQEQEAVTDVVVPSGGVEG